MNPELVQWLIFVAIGIATFAIRLSMILLFSKVEMPPLLTHALRYAPVAVFAAILVPDLVLLKGGLGFAFDNPRLLAGIVAGLIAWKTRNVMSTMAGGMVTLWGLQAILN